MVLATSDPPNLATSRRALIAVSDEIAERAAALGVATDRLHVIPGGVPYSAVEPFAEARRMTGSPPGVRLLLWVGGLVPVKQPLHAIHALSELVESGDDVELVMIGDGPMRSDLEAAIERARLRDRVRLLGYLPRDDVWRWQCAADVLLNSSRSEGSPRAVLEALGAGTPVAAYPLPGVRSAIATVNGGVIADASTPTALAAATSEIFETHGDRSAVAAAARSAFSIESAVSRIEDVYAGVT